MILGQMDMSNVYLAVAVAVPALFVICYVATLLHYDSQNETFKLPFRLPRLPIPWSIASKVRRRRMETELVRVEANLFEAKHTRLQQGLVYSDLEEVQFKKALELEAGDQ